MYVCVCEVCARVLPVKNGGDASAQLLLYSYKGENCIWREKYAPAQCGRGADLWREDGEAVATYLRCIRRSRTVGRASDAAELYSSKKKEERKMVKKRALKERARPRSIYLYAHRPCSGVVVVVVLVNNNV